MIDNNLGLKTFLKHLRLSEKLWILIERECTGSTWVTCLFSFLFYTKGLSQNSIFAKIFKIPLENMGLPSA